MSPTRKGPKGPVARFDPHVGLIDTVTVREAIQTLLDEGFFDHATVAVLCVSTPESYQVRFQGPYWEAQALLARAQHRVQSFLDEA